jgi:hypothetical protein
VLFSIVVLGKVRVHPLFVLRVVKELQTSRKAAGQSQVHTIGIVVVLVVVD